MNKVTANEDATKKYNQSDKNLILSTTVADLQEKMLPSYDEQMSFCYEGGITGSSGICCGQIFFSARKLLEEYEKQLAQQKMPQLILCVSAIFADDIHALELSVGVLSQEGGITDHASVLARQYGKISAVVFDAHLDYEQEKILFPQISFSEGEWITLVAKKNNFPVTIFKGKIPLQENSGEQIIPILQSCKKIINSVENKIAVFANADTAASVQKALHFYADGVGLCRTEHQFFAPNQLPLIKALLLSVQGDCENPCNENLEKMQDFQTEIFFQLLSLLQGKLLTVRLLDVPLHEFGFFIEKNPMLALRGCRLGLSFPKIYEVQIKALAHACSKYLLQKGNHICLRIMIPLVINEREVRQLFFGKKILDENFTGLANLFFETLAQLNTAQTNLSVAFGVMIETPAACIKAAKIAQYASFFSFGTNDLTQTTLALSRDDFFRFSSIYSKYDILENPFFLLDDSVQNLIQFACKNARIVRPDLHFSLCGEQSYTSETLDFCIKNNIHAISCSPNYIPLALLALAKKYLQKFSE